MTLDKLISLVNGLSDMAEQVGATPGDVEICINTEDEPPISINAKWKIDHNEYQVQLWIRTGE